MTNDPHARFISQPGEMRYTPPQEATMPESVHHPDKEADMRARALSIAQEEMAYERRECDPDAPEPYALLGVDQATYTTTPAQHELFSECMHSRLVVRVLTLRGPMLVCIEKMTDDIGQPDGINEWRLL